METKTDPTPIAALRQIASDKKEFCYHSELAQTTLERMADIAKSQSQQSAESVYEMLEQLSILPPEFKGNYLMQARLISGMAATIEKVLFPL